jgi:phage terminase large subunit
MPVTHYDKKHKTIYIFAELYEFGMTNNLLAAAVKKLIGNDLVVCDSAEPKSIEELRTYGVKAVGAVKGPDSVMHGIQWLQQQKFVIDLSCINSKNNIMQYKWKEDKDGKPMPIPLGKNDHIPDALRYGYEGDMIESPGMVDQPERQSIWTGLGDAVEGRSRWRI